MSLEIRRPLAAAGALLLALVASGCRQDMHDQPRVKPLGASDFSHRTPPSARSSDTRVPSENPTQAVCPRTAGADARWMVKPAGGSLRYSHASSPVARFTANRVSLCEATSTRSPASTGAVASASPAAYFHLSSPVFEYRACSTPSVPGT